MKRDLVFGDSGSEMFWRIEAECQYSSLGVFASQRVVDYHLEKAPQTGVAYRFKSDWESDVLIPNLKYFMNSDVAPQATGLIIGAWQGDASDRAPDEVISVLVSNAERLPNLQALYFGDITSEENEMSWIQQSDLSPLLGAFPKLKLLQARGGNDLALKVPKHAELSALILETGGMDKSVVHSVLEGDFPKLEYLELWLGTDEYGATVEVEDLAPLLSGELFPKLKSLGLRNSDLVDQIAPALVGSPLVARLETLDLSLGTLGDVGAEALAALSSPSLKTLDLHHHFMTEPMAQKMQTLPFSVDVSESLYNEDDGDEYRYVAIGE